MFCRLNRYFLTLLQYCKKVSQIVIKVFCILSREREEQSKIDFFYIFPYGLTAV